MKLIYVKLKRRKVDKKMGVIFRSLIIDLNNVPVNVTRFSQKKEKERERERERET